MIVEFRTPMAVQAARIAELERRPGLDSSNSGTPSSSDGRAKPTAAELKERRLSRLRRAARVVYRSVAPLVPRRQLRQTLADRIGVHLSQGTVAGRIARAAERSGGLARHIRDAGAQAPVKPRDATGIRGRGRLAWLPVAGTGRLSHFRVGAGRGDVMRDATGIAVHDHGRPSVTIPGTAPALCAAHILRELQDRVDFDDEAGAERMARRLRRAVHAVNLSDGKPRPERLTDLIGRRYDGIVTAGIAMHEARPPPPAKGSRGRRKRRRGHNRALRLRDGVLRFTRDPAVPATNTAAERALRPLKGQQKISGRVRSEAGARNPAVLRTVLDTACKQGWTRLDTLRAPPEELVEQLVTRQPAQAG